MFFKDKGCGCDWVQGQKAVEISFEYFGNLFLKFFKLMIQYMIEHDLSLWIIFNTVPLVIGSNRTFSISNGELVMFNVTDGDRSTCRQIGRKHDFWDSKLKRNCIDHWTIWLNALNSQSSHFSQCQPSQMPFWLLIFL